MNVERTHDAQSISGWFAPSEDGPHERTWMAWPARADLCGGLLEELRRDVANVAREISRFEPVALVVRSDQSAEAAQACGAGVEPVIIHNDSLWTRDMGPVFVVDGEGGIAGVDMNFNGWGGKLAHENDRHVARQILEWLGIPRFEAPFVAEGGGLVVDGAGTVLATESAIVNPNRNPAKTREELESEICAFLGAEKMLWVKGLVGQDITDYHIDALARFLGPSTVIVDQPADRAAATVWADAQRDALATLEAATNCAGERLRCVVCRESATVPPHVSEIFVNSYLNWYVCNGAVFLPAFADTRADAAAHDLAEQLYPGRSVVQLRIDAIAQSGGGIHCATQQQPRADLPGRSA